MNLGNLRTAEGWVSNACWGDPRIVPFGRGLSGSRVLAVVEVFFGLWEAVRVMVRAGVWTSAGGWEVRKLDAPAALPVQVAHQDLDSLSGKKNKGDTGISPKTVSRAFPS
jgi:hypothetical protein